MQQKLCLFEDVCSGHGRRDPSRNGALLRPPNLRLGQLSSPDEPSRAEPGPSWSRGGPSRVGAGRAGSGRAGPSRARRDRAEPSRARAEPGRAELEPGQMS